MGTSKLDVVFDVDEPTPLTLAGSLSTSDAPVSNSTVVARPEDVAAPVPPLVDLGGPCCFEAPFDEAGLLAPGRDRLLVGADYGTAPSPRRCARCSRWR